MLTRSRPPDEELRLADTTRLGRPTRVGLDPAIFLRVSRVGFPVLLSSLLFNGIYLVIQRIAQAAGGPAAQNALGVGWNGEGAAFVVCLGWSAAAASLVGRALGAGRPDEAARAAWRASLQAAVLCFAWGVVLYVGDDAIAGVFTSDPAVLHHGTAYLRIVAGCLAPQAVEIVLDGAFGGAGHTVPPMVITIGFSLLRIPLGLWLAFPVGLGPAGIWWAIAITATLRGAACAAWFARGTWRTRTV
jgi:Na+-driven multidrug efflux pump